MNRACVMLSIVVLVFCACAEAQDIPSNVRVVDLDAPQPGDGMAWSTALVDIQSAIEAAVDNSEIDEIWVAAGTYYPTLQVHPDDPRSRSFVLADGVHLYGGFLGNAASDGGETARSERRPETNVTALDGNPPGGPQSYHVVTAAGIFDDNTVFSGFTVRGGRADGVSDIDRRGGGMDMNFADLTVTRCRFTSNSAALLGGAVTTRETNPIVDGTRFIDCRFDNNSSGAGGGAFYLMSNSVEFINCLFHGNDAAVASEGADSAGGAIHLSSIAGNQIEAVLHNCTIAMNSAGVGGGISLGAATQLTATNTIMWGNVAATGSVEGHQIADGLGNPPLSQAILTACCVEGLNLFDIGGLLNIGDDPAFTDPGAGNFRLQIGSPCQDTGETELVPLDAFDIDDDGIDDERTPDLDVFDRVIGPAVDRGAHELQGACAADLTLDGVVDVDDLLAVLGGWGGPGGDTNGDGVTDVEDLLAILGAWGPCSGASGEAPPEGVGDCLARYGQWPERAAACILAVTGGE